MGFLEALMVWLRFSNVVPNGTMVPAWAFLDVTVSWGVPVLQCTIKQSDRSTIV
jgi:hypothetical protein